MDLCVTMVAFGFKLRAISWDYLEHTTEPGELWAYITKQGEISSCPGMAWVSSGERCKAIF